MHAFRERGGLPLEDHGVALLQGGKTPHLYNSDNEPLFRWGLPLAVAGMRIRVPRWNAPLEYGKFKLTGDKGSPLAPACTGLRLLPRAAPPLSVAGHLRLQQVNGEDRVAMRKP